MFFNNAVMARAEKYRAALTDEDFRANAKVEDDGVTLILDGVVGDEWEEMDARSVATLLADHKDKPVSVRMNSYGGLVFDGIAIYNAFKSHKGHITGVIEGVAASAMSLLAMGVDDLAMAGNSVLMVHRAWGGAVGNRADMEDVAETLGIIDEQLAKTYAARTGMSIEDTKALLIGKVDGTWLGPEKALELGFIDRVLPLSDSKKEASANAAERIRKQKMANHVAMVAQMIDIDER